MSDDVVQLDLTLSVADVPQANSLPLFVRLMEAIARGITTTEALAEHLEVEERTVQYYVDFGRWLRMLENGRPGHVAFTDVGRSFTDSTVARGRLFATAIFARKLVKTVQVLKRDSANEDDLETLDTRAACLKAILALTDLSEVTARRRASGLAAMLEAAYKPSSIDWETGEPRPEFRRKLDYEGRSFLTSLAARQFGSVHEFRIGFPLQVRRFVEHEGHGINARLWRRASFPTADGKAVWYGSVPINPSTVEVATRGGRDLRRFLLMVAPYVTLAVAALTYRDAAGRRTIRLTHDMYGLSLWDRERELGSFTAFVEELAGEMEVEPTRGVPSALSQADADLLEPGTDADLIETLVAAGFVARKDTTYELGSGIDSELREAREDTASLADLLRPLWDALRELLR